ncbi:hypothetical protein BDA96_05G142200 [Sorghum bicolor]|uniref:Uncharacterized protein n=2 Tax=Sorghum bicolor TaxID=4558 RepID=A0A921QZ68_SORBI|nr:hypothetical protein BDA96_05G142200 [Sorghum bicolor]OQU83512.1 hypothetical protein SORBI_3005G129650 [Sorghum bicolor]
MAAKAVKAVTNSPSIGGAITSSYRSKSSGALHSERSRPVGRHRHGRQKGDPCALHLGHCPAAYFHALRSGGSCPRHLLLLHSVGRPQVCGHGLQVRLQRSHEGSILATYTGIRPDSVCGCFLIRSLYVFQLDPQPAETTDMYE